jgi:hypothetical protein
MSKIEPFDDLKKLHILQNSTNVEYMLFSKLNELIEAHNHHIKTCHLEVHIDGEVTDKFLAPPYI